MASVFCVLFKKFLLLCGHEDIFLCYLQDVLSSYLSHLGLSFQELIFVCCEVRVKVPFFPICLSIWVVAGSIGSGEHQSGS